MIQIISCKHILNVVHSVHTFVYSLFRHTVRDSLMRVRDEIIWSPPGREPLQPEPPTQTGEMTTATIRTTRAFQESTIQSQIWPARLQTSPIVHNRHCVNAMHTGVFPLHRSRSQPCCPASYQSAVTRHQRFRKLAAAAHCAGQTPCYATYDRLLAASLPARTEFSWTHQHTT